MAKIPAWSFSSLKTFTTCPKKFYHTKVLKDIKEPEGEQALYGKLVHEVAELYIRDGKEIPEKFAFIKPALDSLLKIQGEKFCELKMALTEKLEPCDFFDPDCWFRGVADLVFTKSVWEIFFLQIQGKLWATLCDQAYRFSYPVGFLFLGCIDFSSLVLTEFLPTF